MQLNEGLVSLMASSLKGASSTRCMVIMTLSSSGNSLTPINGKRPDGMLGSGG